MGSDLFIMLTALRKEVTLRVTIAMVNEAIGPNGKAECLAAAAAVVVEVSIFLSYLVLFLFSEKEQNRRYVHR